MRWNSAWVVVCGLALIAACDDPAFSGTTDSAVHDGGDAGATKHDAAIPGDAPSSDAGVETDSATVEPDAASDDGSVMLPDDAGATPDSGYPCTTTFYRDADGDGFGDPATELISCTAPTGYVANGSDCYDANKDAHPGQEMWFVPNRGDGSYDYDCDGEQTPVTTTLMTCTPNPNKAGWATAVAPGCGETASYHLIDPNADPHNSCGNNDLTAQRCH